VSVIVAFAAVHIGTFILHMAWFLAIPADWDPTASLVMPYNSAPEAHVLLEVGTLFHDVSNPLAPPASLSSAESPRVADEPTLGALSALKSRTIGRAMSDTVFLVEPEIPTKSAEFRLWIRLVKLFLEAAIHFF